MPLQYKLCGSENIPAHVCNPCISVELGGIRGVTLIEADLVPFDNGLINKSLVETPEWWDDGIQLGKIHVIPKTRGTFDGGSPTTLSAFGDVKEMVISKNFTLVFNDPDHRENEEFYASLAKAP